MVCSRVDLWQDLIWGWGRCTILEGPPVPHRPHPHKRNGLETVGYAALQTQVVGSNPVEFHIQICHWVVSDGQLIINEYYGSILSCPHQLCFRTILVYSLRFYWFWAYVVVSFLEPQQGIATMKRWMHSNWHRHRDSGTLIHTLFKSRWTITGDSQ
jgi:hypothetical protein